MTVEQVEGFPLEDEISFYRLLPLKRTGSNSTPDKRPNLFYPIFWSKKTRQISVEEEKGKDWVKILPIDSNGEKRVWRWGKESVNFRSQTELIVKEREGKYSVFAKDRIKEGRKPKTVWADPKYDASSHGTILLQKILGKSRSFDYPKSLYAVLDTLQICLNSNKEAIVLDFFAGSGTTGHAVMLLNKEDEGHRQFILCTNNEGEIAEQVCYPRIKYVIRGQKENPDITGIPSNLKYFRTDFVSNEPTDKNKVLITEKSTSIICLRENTFELVKENKEYVIYKNQNYYTGVIFNPQVINEFKSILLEIDKEFHVYVFSLSDDTYEEEFADIETPLTLCPIPESILKAYRRIFK